jgi:uncharacterized protein (DUF2132 family)
MANANTRFHNNSPPLKKVKEIKRRERVREKVEERRAYKRQHQMRAQQKEATLPSMITRMCVCVSHEERERERGSLMKLMESILACDVIITILM